MISRLFLLVIFTFGFSLESVEAYVFTSTDGISLEAEVVAMGDGNVRLKRSGDDREFTVPLSRLCDLDRAYLNRWNRFQNDDKHPLGWKTFYLNTGDARGLVSAGGFYNSVTRLSQNEFKLTLPLGAWINVEYELNHNDFRDPQFLLRFDGRKEWNLSFEDGFLYQTDSNGEDLKIVGAAFPRRESERYIQRRYRQMPDGVAIYCASTQIERIAQFQLKPSSVFLWSTMRDETTLQAPGLAGIKAIRLLSEIKGLANLTTSPELEYLEINQDSDLGDLATLGKLPLLTTLVLDSKLADGEVAELKKAATIRYLKLGSRVKLKKEHFSFLSALKQLESLYSSVSNEVDSVILGALPNLTNLSVAGTDFDENGRDLLPLRKLTNFYLPVSIGSKGIQTLEEAGCFSEVRSLKTYREVSPTAMPHLVDLNFDWKGFKGTFAGWQGANELQTLSLSGIDQLGLEALVKQPWAHFIEKLTVEEANITDIQYLKELTCLKSLELSKPGASLQSLNFDSFNQLTYLRLKEIHSVTAIENVVSLPLLKHLTIDGANQLQSLDPLATVNRVLEELRVTDCKSLTDLKGFENCNSIRFFIATRCPELTTLSGIPGNNPLGYAYVSDCVVKDLQLP